ncbi:MAG TPA: hypothetical protein PKB02_06380 [Anaerohalosphaeraceae bacterium]|nr:hypothetical protein [Anaerohalosphaeraceae bacterium]
MFKLVRMAVFDDPLKHNLGPAQAKTADNVKNAYHDFMSSNVSDSRLRILSGHITDSNAMERVVR